MRKTILFLAALCVAVAATAQAPDSIQSNAPTSRAYRMKIVSPLEGSTIQGPDFDIVLGQPPATPPGTSVVPEERRDALTPSYQIWIDGKDFGKIPIGQNVLHATGVATGPHKIVIVAKNTAGELVDRRELGVTTAATGIAETQTTQVTTETAPAPAPPPAYVPPPAPAPVAAPPAPVETELPHTATGYPQAAMAGLLLVAAGVALRLKF